MAEGDSHSADVNVVAPGAWPVAWPRSRLRAQGDRQTSNSLAPPYPRPLPTSHVLSSAHGSRTATQVLRNAGHYRGVDTDDTDDGETSAGGAMLLDSLAWVIMNPIAGPYAQLPRWQRVQMDTLSAPDESAALFCAVILTSLSGTPHCARVRVATLLLCTTPAFPSFC